MASVKAKIAVRAPEARSAPSKEARKRRLYLLPSLRVAAFVVPNISEFIDMRNEVFARVSRRVGDRAPTSAELSFEMGTIALRTLLVGLSVRPVKPILTRAFDVEAERPKIEEGLRKALTDKWREDHDGSDPPEAWLARSVIENFDSGADQALTALEDVEAMKKSAILSEVTDVAWDLGHGAVGELLKEMPFADLGTPDAHDWDSLERISRMLMPDLGGSGDSPKAERVRIAPLR